MEDPKTRGEEIERYIGRIFHAHKVSADAYDLENKTSLIEVKSCEALHATQTNNNKHGRFTIIPENHEELIKAAKLLHKKPLYVFVLRIGNRKIFCKLNAKKLKIDDSKDYYHINWGRIFYNDCNN